MASFGSRRAERRRLLIELLGRWDLGGLQAAYQQDQGLLTALPSLLGETEDRLRWRAVHGLGLLAAVRAAQELEPVRELIRRQLWAMNDESGNVAWHAPEAIAEVLYQVPALAAEYAPNLMAHLEEPLFRIGVCWGMARLAPRQPELVAQEQARLSEALGDGEPAVRGYAVLALGALRRAARAAAPTPTGDWLLEGAVRRELHGALAALQDDPGCLQLFEEAAGELRQVRVGELARQAISD